MWKKAVGGFALDVEERLDMGALCYRDSGEDMSKCAFEAVASADAILMGAMGWPAIRYPDGTEMSPHLKLREEFGLYAGVRPVKAFPNTPRRLLRFPLVEDLAEEGEGAKHVGLALGEAAHLIEVAVEEAFATRALRPMELGGDQGLKAATQAVAGVLEAKLNDRRS